MVYQLIKEVKGQDRCVKGQIYEIKKWMIIGKGYNRSYVLCNVWYKSVM